MGADGDPAFSDSPRSPTGVTPLDTITHPPPEIHQLGSTSVLLRWSRLHNQSETQPIGIYEIRVHDEIQREIVEIVQDAILRYTHDLESEKMEEGKVKVGERLEVVKRKELATGRTRLHVELSNGRKGWISAATAAGDAIVKYLEGDNQGRILTAETRVISVAGLTALTSYHVQVRAISVDELSSTEWSPLLKVQTKALMPDMPRTPNVLRSADVSNEAFITITPPADNGLPIERFYVRWWAVDEFGTKIAGSQGETHGMEEVMCISELSHGAHYVFSCSASNALGMSPWSPLAALVLEQIPPVRPQPPNPVPRYAGQVMVHFSPGETNTLLRWWLIYGKDPNLETDSDDPEIPTFKHEFSMRTLQVPLIELDCQATYYFAVVVGNAFSDSERSEVASCVVREPTLPGQPSAPIARCKQNSPDTATLRWNAPIDYAGEKASKITGYKVRMLGSERDRTAKVYEVEEEYAEIPDLGYTKDYRFQVQAGNVTGFGDWSEPSNPVQMPVPVPDAPAKAFVRKPTHHSVLVQWQHPPCNAFPIDTFRIRYCAGDTTFAPEKTTEIHDIPNKLSSYTVKNLEHGIAYYIQVSAVSKIGQGRWSAPSAPIKTLEGAVPSKVKGLCKLYMYRSLVTLSWNTVENNGFPVTQSKLRYATKANLEDAKELMTVEGAATQCPVTHLSQKSVYYFQVAAVNNLGIGAWSDALCLEVFFCSAKGCEFSGTDAEVKKHEEACQKSVDQKKLALENSKIDPDSFDALQDPNGPLWCKVCVAHRKWVSLAGSRHCTVCNMSLRADDHLAQRVRPATIAMR